VPLPSTALGAGLMTLPSTRPQVSRARASPSRICGRHLSHGTFRCLARGGRSRRAAARAPGGDTGRYHRPVCFDGHRLVYDRLVGLVGFILEDGPTSDRRAHIEAVEQGWWYSPFQRPAGRCVHDRRRPALRARLHRPPPGGTSSGNPPTRANALDVVLNNSLTARIDP
jgi:hypothetical protein